MKNILVIDDQEFVTETLKYSFEKEGYKVYFSDNGKQGLKSLKQNDIDLIITDINMPKMNGIEFIKRIRKKEKYKQIPVIVLTTDRWNKEECRKAGATGWVSKPYSFKKILTTVNSFLQ